MQWVVSTPLRSTSPKAKWVAGPALAVLLFVGCERDEPRARPEATPRAAPAKTPSGGTITFGVLGAPPTLDPHSELASDLTYALARPVYRSLYRVAPDGAVEPDLVASARREGRDVLVVTLGSARWSDGTRVAARDVVATVNRAAPPSGFAGLEATAIDGRTVRLERDVSGDWGRRLAIGSFVLPRGRAGRVASGPFVRARHVPGLQVVYEPNPEWNGTEARLDRLRVQFISTVTTMLELLERRELDAAAVPSTINTGERLDALGIEHSHRRGWETVALDLEEITGVAGRAGIIAAIDTAPIAEGLIRDEGRVVRSRMPGGGDPAPSEIQLATVAGDELLQLMQRILQRQLARHQIKAELVAIDPAIFYGSWQDDAPVDVLLERVIVPFGERAAPKDLAWYPLFGVDSIVASTPGIHGPGIVHGGSDGPLWNAEEWWRE